jgi:hypothetical protein
MKWMCKWNNKESLSISNNIDEKEEEVIMTGNSN